MVGRTLGHYRVVERIGAGAMGEVYRAWDQRLERDVALKVLPGALAEDEEARHRLRREALALSRLSHPNIAVVYDFDVADGTAFVAMELVPGQDLRDLVRAGPVDEKEVIRLGVQIADAVQAAHAAGVVHRDLKPANIRVTPDGHIKVLDFGVAARVIKNEDPTRVATGSLQFAGTLPYMAPEQLGGRPPDVRSDIYALSCVLYELATRKRPFESHPDALLIDQILNDPPLSPCVHNPHIGHGLEAVIVKGLEKNPNLRYQTAREVVVDLERLRLPTTVTARTRLRTAGRQQTPWRRAVIVPVLLIMALAGWLVWRQQDQPALALGPRDLVMAGAVTNATGDAALDGSLRTALQISLEQSPHVNLLSPDRVRRSLQRMRRSEDTAISEEVAREICQRENARALLTGAIESAGGQYVLSVRIVDPRSGATVRTFTQRAASRDRILTSIDDLVRPLRRALGESLSSIDSSSRTLAEVTTASLEALQNFSEAQRLSSRGRLPEARTLFERAIQLDPDFARAYAALATTYHGYGLSIDSARAERYFQEALRRLDRVSDRERHEIQALYHGALGRYEQAESFYRLLVDRYPGSEDYHFYLARQYEGLQRCPAALEEYRRAFDLNPGASQTLIRISSCESALHRWADSRRSFEQAIALDANWEVDQIQNHQYGWALIQTGAEDRARALFSKMLTIGSLGRARGYRSLGLLALYRGKLREASQALEEASRANAVEQAFNSAARDLLYLAEGQLLVREREAAARSLKRAADLLERGDHPDWLMLRSAVLWARAGNIAQATRLVESNRSAATSADATVRADWLRADGELLLARRNVDLGLERLRQAHTTRPWLSTELSLARGLSLAAKSEEAIPLLEKLVRGSPEPWEGHVAWALAHEDLARQYRRVGKPQESRATYERLLEIWKDADQDLPALADVRLAMR